MTGAARYRARRAAGLCGDCGDPSVTARCTACTNLLADRRDRSASGIGDRLDFLGPDRTLSSIGARLGLTRSRVQQIVDDAIVKIHLRLRALPGNAEITREDVLLSLARLALLSGETQPTVTAADRSTRGGKASGYWRGKLAASRGTAVEQARNDESAAPSPMCAPHSARHAAKEPA